LNFDLLTPKLIISCRCSMNYYRALIWRWSFLAYTPDWPVVLILLLLHPPGTLYQLTLNCAKTFSLSNATWKPICSNSLSPVLLQVPLYLQT